MIGIGPDRLTCAPCGKLAGRILLPLNMLAPNLRNLDAALAFVDHPERRARLDRLQLLRVAAQHDLGAGVGRMGQYEIGRATCTARVCQSGYTAGVADSLNTTT